MSSSTPWTWTSDVTRLWQKQAMPAPESVCLLKLYPNWAEIGYFRVKTLKFIYLPSLLWLKFLATSLTWTPTIWCHNPHAVYIKHERTALCYPGPISPFWLQVLMFLAELYEPLICSVPRTSCKNNWGKHEKITSLIQSWSPVEKLSDLKIL